MLVVAGGYDDIGELDMSKDLSTQTNMQERNGVSNLNELHSPLCPVCRNRELQTQPLVGNLQTFVSRHRKRQVLSNT